MKKDGISTAAKGLIVGGTMLVPGVSGGSMAMILGIYDRLVSSVSSFTKQKKESFFFLTVFTFAALAGMILFASPLLALIEAYTKPMMFFFLGTVAGGIPMMYQKARVQAFSWKLPVYVIGGILAVMLVSLFPAEAFSSGAGGTGVLVLASAGFVAAIALILPGISISYLLLMLGIYQDTMKAISTFDLGFLTPMGIGLLLGIVLTTKVLEGAMQRYPQPTYLIIMGFIIGSAADVFPGLPVGWEWVLCSLSLMMGFGLIRLLTENEMIKTEKIKKSSEMY